jgi:WD40 repeat protein
MAFHANSEHSIQILDTARPDAPLRTLKVPKGRALSISWSCDNRYLAYHYTPAVADTFTYIDPLIIFDAATGTQIREFPATKNFWWAENDGTLITVLTHVPLGDRTPNMALHDLSLPPSAAPCASFRIEAPRFMYTDKAVAVYRCSDRDRTIKIACITQLSFAKPINHAIILRRITPSGVAPDTFTWLSETPADIGKHDPQNNYGLTFSPNGEKLAMQAVVAQAAGSERTKTVTLYDCNNHLYPVLKVISLASAQSQLADLLWPAPDVLVAVTPDAQSSIFTCFDTRGKTHHATRLAVGSPATLGGFNCTVDPKSSKDTCAIHCTEDNEATSYGTVTMHHKVARAALTGLFDTPALTEPVGAAAAAIAHLTAAPAHKALPDISK